MFWADFQEILIIAVLLAFSPIYLFFSESGYHFFPIVFKYFYYLHVVLLKIQIKQCKELCKTPSEYWWIFVNIMYYILYILIYVLNDFKWGFTPQKNHHLKWCIIQILIQFSTVFFTEWTLVQLYVSLFYFFIKMKMYFTVCKYQPKIDYTSDILNIIYNIIMYESI